VRLLERVFEIGIGHRLNCGGELKVIAAILESALAERLDAHRGLPARAPPCPPARVPMSQAA
jgi:hypothetical protein